MRIRISCHLALVVMLCYSRDLMSETRNEHHEPFCLFTKSALGHTQCSFLRRSVATSSLLFYWTIWTTSQRVEQCVISAEADLIQHYLTWCHGKRTWYSNETKYLPVNISLLLESASPCQLRPRQLGGLTRYRRNLDLGHHASKIRQKRSWILVPGTLWCGRGSSAGTYDQLGLFEHVDRCCREHDHCSHVIHPFTVNFGIFNPSFFTISHCDCDHRFKQCLQKVNDTVSNMVGYTFFNILKHRCFDLIQKRHCTQLSWFGMCTSVQDAPFAVLKNPIPYNLSTSNPETGISSDPPEYQMQPSTNGKAKHIKHKQRRKQSKAPGKNTSVALGRGDAFLLREKMKQRYKTKKSPMTTILPPLRKLTTQPNLFTIQNSTLFSHKNQTMIKQRTLSIHKSDLMNQMTLSPGPARTMHIHKRVSQAKRFNAQNQRITPMKKMLTNKRKSATSQNATMQINIMQSFKPLKSKENCDSISSKKENNCQCKMDSTSNLIPQNILIQALDRLFPTMKKDVNKTQLNKKTHFPSKTNTIKNMISRTFQCQINSGSIIADLISITAATRASQNFKGSLSLNMFISADINNKSVNITNAPKTKNATKKAKLLVTIKPRCTLPRDILIHKTALSVNASLIKSYESSRFKKHSSTENKYTPKTSILSKNSSVIEKSSNGMTTAPGSIAEKQNSAKQKTSVSKKKRIYEKTETPKLWFQNETSSDCEEPTGYLLICDAVLYSHKCKYRTQPMDKIYGYHNMEQTTVYQCNWIYRFTDNLKQLKKDNILEFLFEKFVSLSCIEIANIKKCKKTGCPQRAGFTADENGRRTNCSSKKNKIKKYQQTLQSLFGVLNPRNPKHLRKVITDISHS